MKFVKLLVQTCRLVGGTRPYLEAKGAEKVTAEWLTKYVVAICRLVNVFHLTSMQIPTPIAIHCHSVCFTFRPLLATFDFVARLPDYQLPSSVTVGGH